MMVVRLTVVIIMMMTLVTMTLVVMNLTQPRWQRPHKRHVEIHIIVFTLSYMYFVIIPTPSTSL